MKTKQLERAKEIEKEIKVLITNIDGISRQAYCKIENYKKELQEIKDNWKGNEFCGQYLGYRHLSGAKALCGDDVVTHIVYCKKCKKKNEKQNKEFKEICKRVLK